jgi:hypothetical protein
MTEPTPFDATPMATAAVRAAVPAPWLVSHLYALGDPALRSRLLGRLLQPLGTLGMAAVAAGAFACFVQRRTAQGVRVVLDDAQRYSAEQVLELARFVEQVNPEALQRVLQRLAEAPTLQRLRGIIMAPLAAAKMPVLLDPESAWRP